jgi:quinohemoprotein ethanol dehydrogenase
VQTTRLLKSIIPLAAAALALAGCSMGPAQPVEEAMVAAPDEWPGWGRTGYETHYSPLDEIDTGNVDSLALAWHYDLEPGFTPSTPIMADGKLYITTGHSMIRAFAADTGKLLWEYDGKTRERAKSALHFGWGSKGIAYGDGKVVLGTTDGYVIALDANSGEEVWKTFDYPDDAPRNIGGAPRVFGDKVIIGHGGADITPLRGYVSAYDLATGKLAWRFYTVPGENADQSAGAKAAELMDASWPSGWRNEDGSRRGGGGTAWNAFSYDPELGLIYLGVGNGFPYNQQKRSPDGGDNLFLASIVAVDAKTGEYRWHYQVCPAEQWDCTATTDMTLATLEIDGQPRKVLMQAPKNGFLYVLDRETGEFLSAEKVAKVTWADKIDPETGRPVENPGIRYQGKPGLFELWPGVNGAHSWMPQAYSPQTGLLYIPITDKGALIGEGQEGGAEISAGMGVTVIPEAELEDNNKSYLKAIDPATQKEAWRVDLPGNTPGGVLATAGNLVFQGRMDGYLVAYDAKSGKELWKHKTASPVLGAPISYRMGGKQYVAVMTGTSGTGAGIQSLGNAALRTDYRQPRRLLVFAIGGADALKAEAMPELVSPEDPGFVVDLERAQKGAMLFGTNTCLVCHGWNAVGGGAAPDLRYSPVITDAATFRSIVKGGALRSNGMPPYPQISDADLETIRFYLRARARAAPGERKALLEKAAGFDASAKAADFVGTWDIVIQSPVGEQPATMTLSADGEKLSGKVTAEQGDVAVTGAVEGGRAKLSGEASMGMTITVAYDMGLSGGNLVGENANGPFGTFPMTGSKKD